MRERVRLEDVAQLAGVSAATVSRVLSHPHLVSQSRRGRVLQAVETLGYVPDGSARALASGKTHTVGCVVPFLDQAIFAKSTQALQAALLPHGYQLLIASHEYSLEREYEAVLALQKRSVDALVLVGTDHATRTWDAVTQWGKPVILNWSCDPRLPSVGFDNYALAGALVEHLLALGHQKIGVVSGYTLHNDRARARIQGVRDAMARQNLTLDPAYISEQNFQFSGGRLGLAHLWTLNPRPTAVLCGNDLLAIGALFEAQRLGIDVPQELSVCGIDNSELSREVIPPLTTVDLSTAQLGQCTANQIIKALEGSAIEQAHLLPFALMLRASTCAPSPQVKPATRMAQ